MTNDGLIGYRLLAVLLAALAAPPAAADPPHARVARFDAWRLVCAPEGCAALTARTAADGTEVLRLAVTSDPPELAVLTPLPLHLPDGIALALGDPPEIRAPWRTCNSHDCEATLPLDDRLVRALRRERSGTATFTLEDGVPVRLPFSLMGFAAAWRALAERELSP